MEHDDHETENDQEDAIAEQDQWDLVRRVQQEGQVPTVSIPRHLSDDKEDRLGNHGCPDTHRSLSIVEDSDREFFDEVVRTTDTDKSEGSLEAVEGVLASGPTLHYNLLVVE